MTLDDTEIGILRKARGVHPNGIASPEDRQSVEYAAFTRLVEEGALRVFLEVKDAEGMRSRREMASITERGLELLIVADSLSAQDMGTIIIQTVVNVQRNQNALGVQVSDAERHEVESAVNGAPPSVLKRALKEWVPQAVVGAAVSTLLQILVAS